MVCRKSARLVLILGIVLALVPGGPSAQAKGSSAKAKQQLALKWEACEDAPEVQCSTLRVPLDWSRPRGPEVSLALTGVPARDRERRVGSMLFNCGGPGCPSAQVVKLLPGVFTPRLRERFDIVGFDPRATGESTPVRCGLPSFDPSIPRYPGTEADFERLLDF